MKTRYQEMTSGGIDGYSNFLGNDDDYKEWFGILGQSRDSNCLERSNFEVGLKMLGGESETVRVERYGHWAVGWIEEIYVKPNSKAYEIAKEIESKLADYPILDESDFSDKEWNEANEVWKNCYSPKERIDYIRKHYSQFEFRDFRDLLACVRGLYFCGYASELIG
jgi:hypothetical protein